MDKILLLIFFLSALLILHTYLFYPVFMISAFRKPRVQLKKYGDDEQLPEVAVLVAAYNEEKVIEEKILSVFSSDYPRNRIRVYIGSDASDDNTERIVNSLKDRYPQLSLLTFRERIGKISVINYLQSLGNPDILIMTDANVMFTRATIRELVNPFKDDRVGIVAANIAKVSPVDEGISFQEKKYLSMENMIKYAESNAFNLVMGAEGGCYAIRNDLFSKVPQKFNVDDFYITLQVLARGKFAVFSREAICIEDAVSDMSGEYRRKVRISSGNFQNLFFFRRNLLAFWKPLGFAFWSHKVLRWLTPFFLLAALISSALLGMHSKWFMLLAALQLIAMCFPLLDRLLSFQARPAKFISHFYMMNLALLEGFFRFTSGIQSSIWQPVKRNV